MRRVPTVVLLLALLAAVLQFAPASSTVGAAELAQTDDVEMGDGVVQVIEVSGLIDAILVDFITDEVARAEANEVTWLVLQMNSPGSVVSDDDLARVARSLADASVPVAVWVGPSGSEALGGAAQIAAVADRIGVSIGSKIGETGVQVLPSDEFGTLFGAQADRLQDGVIESEEALAVGMSDDSTLGDFVVDLDGVETVTVDQGDQQRRQLKGRVSFAKIPLLSGWMHSVASPALTYLLLIIGLALIIFELYTAGVGVAGAVAALCIVLSGYGLGVLPIRPVGLALIVLSFIAFAVDVQTGVPRAWTAIGFAMFVLGTLLLFNGVALSWLTILVGFVSIAVTYLSGMPSMVRTRFSTPTIGREWMIGEMGVAISDIGTTGQVAVRNAPWRAQTNRATPITMGDRVRVVQIDGLVLEVEPEDGGARDYRERG